MIKNVILFIMLSY